MPTGARPVSHRAHGKLQCHGQPTVFVRATRESLHLSVCARRPRLSTRLTLLDCSSAACLTEALYLPAYICSPVSTAVRGECLSSCLSMVRD
jgi:hypothetical protein